MDAFILGAFLIDRFYLKTSSSQKCVFLLVPSVECLTLTVRNDMCVQSHIIKGSMTCDIIVSRETDPGPIFSEISRNMENIYTFKTI